MRFKKLQLKNIRSYEEMEIVFPRGSTLLSGEIGSGKTSILLGLQFALFGLQPGQKGSSILRQGEDTAYARLELEIEGQSIEIQRSIKRSKNGSITQDSNCLTIGTRREELSTSEMKERVIRLLNYPKEFAKKSNLLYKFTVYTPQEEMKSIIQERPEIRLDTLRHIFGIDRYKRIKENAQIFIQKIKETLKIKEVLAAELNLLREKFTIENERKIALARQTNNLVLEKAELDEEQKENQEKIQEIEKTIEEKQKIDARIATLTIQLQGKQDLGARLKNEVALMQRRTQEKIEFSQEQLTAVSDHAEKHKRVLEEKQKSFITICSKISALESKKESPLSMKEAVNSLENCPTCFQQVSSQHKSKISKKMQFEIDDANRDLESVFAEKKACESLIEKTKELIKGYEQDRAHMQEAKIKYAHQKELETKIKSDAFVLDRTSNEITTIRSEIKELEDKGDQFSSVQERYKEIKKELSAVEEMKHKKEIILATRKKELEIVKQGLMELQEDIKNKEKIREEINTLRSLQDFLQEKFVTMITLTEKNVMAKLRAEFSRIFAEWFSMLASDSLTVRLDEDFTPIIGNQDYDIEYDFLSGGERTAVALAYRLALNQVLNSMLSHIKTKDIVILDEPTDGFATEQIDKMRDIFEQLKAEQTILVSHEQKIEGFVDHVIRIRKEGISVVEEA